MCSTAVGKMEKLRDIFDQLTAVDDDGVEGNSLGIFFAHKHDTKFCSWCTNTAL